MFEGLRSSNIRGAQPEVVYHHSWSMRYHLDCNWSWSWRWNHSRQAVGLACFRSHVLPLTFPRAGSQNLPLPTNAERYTGDLTYYGVGLGACGISSNDNQNVVAVSHILWDSLQTGSNPNSNPLCGQKIRATRFYQEVGGERSVDVTVVDRCTGCQPTDLDVSTAVFKQLAPIPSGRVDVTWAWLSPQPTGT